MEVLAESQVKKPMATCRRIDNKTTLAQRSESRQLHPSTSCSNAGKTSCGKMSLLIFDRICVSAWGYRKTELSRSLYMAPRQQ